MDSPNRDSFRKNWTFPPLSTVATRSSKRLRESTIDANHGDENAVVARSSQRLHASTIDANHRDENAVVTRSSKRLQESNLSLATHTTHGDNKTAVALKAVISNKRNRLAPASKLPVPKAANANVTTIPTELILKIFAHLKPVSATVFSLTCTRFYHIKSDLNYPSLRITQLENGQPLHNLLTQWMAPGLIYAYAEKKFITINRWADVQEERRLAVQQRAEKRSKKKIQLAKKFARAEAQKAARIRDEEDRREYETLMRDLRLRRRARNAEALSEDVPANGDVELQDISEEPHDVSQSFNIWSM